MRIDRAYSNGKLIRLAINGVDQQLTEEIIALHPAPPFLKPRNVPTEAVPKKDWPLWVKAIYQFSNQNDKGIGDVVARIIGEEKSAAFSAWHLATFGKPCNCKGRQARWNKLYPLNQ